MLAELSIKNFAIIEALTISFEKGLTVLTGETGAGKSIIIDAIHLLAGARGSSEFVRYGEKRAELEGLFLLDDDHHPVYSKCEEFGIDVSDGMIVLRRDLSSSGKSICRINGKLVTLAILREIGQYLVDIHGQHDNQELMNADNHLSLLDQYGGQKVKQALEIYRDIFKNYDMLRKKITQLSDNEQEMAHRLDLLQFQLDEIESAELKPNEDVLLLEEKNQIANFEKVYDSLHNSYNALHGEHKGLDWVGHAMSNLEDVASINETLKGLSETISNAYYLLEDLSYQVRNELESLEFDPERLNFVESRLNEINHLKRKYGQTVEEILVYSAKIEEEIDTIQNRESHLDKLQKELQSILQDLSIEAKNVTSIRNNYAKILIEEIHRELKELYMEKTTFDVNFSSKMTAENELKYTASGIDEVEFYLSTNPGEPLKPLNKTASGGELSRIMLAMKSIFSQHQGITSIIFDEVDTGVSGRVAQAIAEKIYRVSIGSQVLCITHLPQVAAMADTHLYIAKQTKSGRTKTSVKPLADEEKIKEIGRMIAGVEVTELSKEHAKELLSLAHTSKG
ncbi:DNA repair protein RecN [Metabacillus sediminilitoris]|uniref:DNA repair protein RecN n=1 Tax=Metabacillus sediminilitoris TaxID=2567941 RepID=A0A4S4BZ28_9BACI|nr:DNA repair protein RecN [Metabacillus sediminilitoris]QGQ47167.1 DNA repair protein RecN [Metabacillus sediminilitoris]THF80510.1 DNA repair protein RecN [Metabacillus sediminilitoris]